MARNGRMSKWEMISEFLREAAVLVLVFVPLDYLRGSLLSPWSVAVVILISAGILGLGIIIERRRP